MLAVNCCSAPAFSQSSSLSLPYAFSQSQTTVKMVNFAFPLFVLGMAASVATAPAPGTSTGTVFSFAAWADDIFANPDTALTPEEAVASAEAADVVGSAGGLTKRVICQDLFKNAPVCFSPSSAIPSVSPR